ncbi:MAG: histidine kinase [Ferruginibacter sp.]|nr:histidine kinase [Ferruginibacter sp.]
MKKFVKLFALFLMSVFHTSCGQNQTNVPQENIKSETKDLVTSQVPNSGVFGIKQDRKGNIWMATNDGVYRYDGRSFSNITSKVSAARFSSVLEDRKGEFWFASLGSGVFYYDGKSFRNFTTRQGLASNHVICIYEDGTGNIWFGTPNGASRYDGKSFRNFKMSKSESPPDSVHVSIYQKRLPENSGLHNDVHAIIQDKTGKLWFGTRGHTFIYDGKNLPLLPIKTAKLSLTFGV